MSPVNFTNSIDISKLLMLREILILYIVYVKKFINGNRQANAITERRTSNLWL